MINPPWAALSTDGEMEKLNLPLLYQLGHELHSLVTASANDTKTIDFMKKCLRLDTTLLTLFLHFPSLKVSKPVSERLRSRMTKWQDDVMAQQEKSITLQEPVANASYALSWLADSIVQEAADLQAVLLAELQSLTAYQVITTGIYSASELVESADDAFPYGLKEKLSDKAIQEIRQSGRCLAFGVGTASGFHILRATEAVMHQYYAKVCNQGNECAPLDNWGAYITYFRKSDDADTKRIVEMLQQVKDHDRNLIMHPDISLSKDEAHTLFEVAKGAIMAMAERL